MSEEKQKSRGFTAYKSPPVERVLKHRPDASAAGRLSDVCERYWHTILSTPLELTDAELSMVSNALSGTFIDPLMVDNLHLEIADERDDANPDQELPEYVVLSKKIKLMSTAEKYALLEKIKR